jgi:hypothetical protein
MARCRRRFLSNTGIVIVCAPTAQPDAVMLQSTRRRARPLPGSIGCHTLAEWLSMPFRPTIKRLRAKQKKETPP